MIPYDDLVTALASWRARQGLPSGQLAGAPAPAPPAAKPAAAAAPSRGRASRPVSVVSEESIDVEAGALLEEASIDSELAAAFGGDDTGEATSIGAAPTPSRRPPRRGGR